MNGSAPSFFWTGTVREDHEPDKMAVQASEASPETAGRSGEGQLDGFPGSASRCDASFWPGLIHAVPSDDV